MSATLPGLAFRMDAESTAGVPRVLIDARALANNLRVLRRAMAATVKFCAVIKADAYGHDARLIARLLTLIEEDDPFCRVDQYAVATPGEALALMPLDKPLMVLRPAENVFVGRSREAIEQVVRAGCTLTLASASAADDIASIALHAGCRANVQIMLDTGMVRCGVTPSQFNALLERVFHHASLHLVGVCTHFVSADVPGDPMTVRQTRAFQAAVDRHAILEGVPRHAANSGATLMSPATHFDAVRVGLALYGIDPTGRPNVDRPLTPVLKWIAPVMAVHDVAAGQGVGYGHAWTAPAPSRIAVVPVGYADGYPRLASNRGLTMVHGIPCGVVGRVSMDSLTIDVTHAGDVGVGDEVTLIDNDPTSPASVYALARAAETIPYEIVTRIGPRVLRVPVGVDAEALADLE